MAKSHSLPILRRSNKIFVSNDYLFSRLAGKKARVLKYSISLASSG